MKISARSALIAGVTTLTIGAVAAAPSVQPLPPPRPEIQLAASSRTLQQQQALLQQFNSVGDVTPLLTGIVVPPGLGTAPPAPPAIPPLPVPTSVASFIDNAYLAIEPWVSYGFEVGAWAFSWVPGIGWLAPQIWPIGYDLGEALIGSAVFNFTDWLQGQGGVIENVVDWGEDAINALIDFGIAEWNFWIGFPLPPLPGIVSTAALTEAAADVGVANAASDLVNAVYNPVVGAIDDAVDLLNIALGPIPLVNIVPAQANILWGVLASPIADSVVFGLIDPVLNQPLNINSYINGAIDVGVTTVNALFNTGLAEANYFLGGGPLLAAATTGKTAAVKTSEVSTVPASVKNSLDGAPADTGESSVVDKTPVGPLADVATTVRNVRKELRSALTPRETTSGDVDDNADAGGNGVVRARGEVRGAVTKAAHDVVDAVRSGKPGKFAEGIAKTPATVAKSLSDNARKVVKETRQAARDARDAAKDRPADDE